MASVRWSRTPWQLSAALALAAASCLACSSMLAEPAPQVETAALHDSSGDAVIATLHTKDSELRITSSGGNVRYALLDADGVSRSLTLEELQSYDRNLYEFVKNVTARRGAPVLDARVLPSVEPPAGSRERLDPLGRGLTERLGAERPGVPPAR